MHDIKRIAAIVVTIAAGALGERALAMDINHPPLPVSDNKVVLPISCESDTPLSWNEEVLKNTGGLRQGDEVWALTATGKYKARLGKLGCWLGECRANYVTINVDLPKPIVADIVAVTPVGSVAEGTEVTAAKSSKEDITACTDLLQSIPNEDTQAKPETSCKVVTVDKDQQIQLAQKGFMQENGWVAYKARARVVSGDKPGQSIDIGSVGNNILSPALILRDRAEGPFVLWTAFDGICCPQAITQSYSVIDKSNSLAFGKRVEAGGQPCD
jgi:hypothetical protein